MGDWLTGIGSLMTGIAALSSGSGGWSWRRQNQLNAEQFNRTVEYNNRVAEYNKPINQVNRLREAGLNPNLLYNSVSTGNVSDGGSFSGSSAGSSTGSTWSQRLSAIGSTLSGLGDIMSRRQARKEAKAQYEKDQKFLDQKRHYELENDKTQLDMNRLRLAQMTMPSPVITDITSQPPAPTFVGSALRSIPLVGRPWGDYVDRKMSGIVFNSDKNVDVDHKTDVLRRYLYHKFPSDNARKSFLDNLYRKGIIDYSKYMQLMEPSYDF